MKHKLQAAWAWLEAELAPFAGGPAYPGMPQAWWWLGVPLLCALLPPLIHAADLGFYQAYINREGWGLLELSHTLVPLASFLLAVGLLMDARVRGNRFLRVWLAVAALGSLYIAGEEASWGQHLIGWDTPDTWRGINDQSETNLHNVSSWLDQKPRLILQLGMLIGAGLAITFARSPRLRASPVALIVPPLAIVPTVLFALAYYVLDDIQGGLGRELVSRPAEVEEIFLYLFVLFYLITLRHRLKHAAALSDQANAPRN